MTILRRKRRGVGDIHTMSGKSNQVFSPFKAHMRIACLEMEKLRKEKDLGNALALIESLRESLQKIEAAKTKIMEELTESRKNNPVAKFISPVSRPQKKGGFKLKY